MYLHVLIFVCTLEREGIDAFSKRVVEKIVSKERVPITDVDDRMMQRSTIQLLSVASKMEVSRKSSCVDVDGMSYLSVFTFSSHECMDQVRRAKIKWKVETQ